MVFVAEGDDKLEGEGLARESLDNLDITSLLVLGVCWFWITDTTVLAITHMNYRHFGWKFTSAKYFYV